MDDPDDVRGGQSRGHVDRDPDRVRGRQLRGLGQRRALGIRHRDERASVFDASMVDRAEARMLQPGEHLDFLPKARGKFVRAESDRPRKDLDGDSSLEHWVFGEMDGRLTATPDFSEQPVPSERGARGRAHGGPNRSEGRTPSQSWPADS